MIRVEPITRQQFQQRIDATPPGPFRLDSSVEPKSPRSRWSYVLARPTRRLIFRDAPAPAGEIHVAGKSSPNPLRTVEEALRALDPEASCETIDASQDAPPFKGGWVGYFSYDLARFFEPLPTIARDELSLPLLEFHYHPRGFAIDLLSNRYFEFSGIEERDAPTIAIEPGAVFSDQAISRTFMRPQYELAVQKVIDYIAAGDVYQVNLSQRFSVGVGRRSPVDLYHRLQREAPSPFAALLDFGNWAIVSNSPELLLRVTPTGDARVIQTRPIKGTRPRRAGMDAELRDSEKDQAELAMIIDLERNDLGRVCRIGSVRVSEPREIEAYPTVYHGAATIEGLLRPDVGLVEILRAIFPGGSVTGAPKIRAMQIIEELEPVRRGPYCGAIGYISCDGAMQFNLAIRTIVVTGGVAHISVGGGIVADSSPPDEYEETLVKAKAMFDAVGYRL